MTTSKKYKSDLDTPCLILDMDILDENLEKMQTAAGREGKDLRPHCKTHKCSALARRQIEFGAIGLCAAKVSEARGLVNAGLENILVTGPVVTPGKMEKLLDLLALSPSLMVVVDHPRAIALLEKTLGKRNMTMGLLLDLDVGLHRTGVGPSEAPALAERIVSSPHLRLLGIQAYAGQVQHIQAYEDRESASYQCLQEAVRVFRRLQDSVPTCTIFSASGTGTFDIDLAVADISELQVGSYVLMDAEYLALETAEPVPFPPALRLLTTVVSTNQEGFVTVDAGLKSLYKDGGRPRVVETGDSPLEYDWFGDEYGMISCRQTAKLPPLGTVLELVTSHCDPTINLFDRYYLTRGQEVTGTWPIDLRGCSQ
ncbi:MAG: DSD1 family PLP-dependent enzyme [Desulfohalobiaceae bacterium]|nr:DSD1 family PLP-dependent enzyme [Desulfohalobiaceae bacterium]